MATDPDLAAYTFCQVEESINTFDNISEVTLMRADEAPASTEESYPPLDTIPTPPESIEDTRPMSELPKDNFCFPDSIPGTDTDVPPEVAMLFSFHRSY